MFYCLLHKWYSTEEACPVCHPIVTTTFTTSTTTPEENKSNDSFQWEDAAKKLWQLLDDIDTSSDIRKPSIERPESLHGFYKQALDYASKRFEILKSDGYNIFPPKPQAENKPDWEIVEFRTPFWGSNDVGFTIGNDGKYSTGLNGEIFTYDKEELLRHKAVIKTVRRTSDSQVFSVGDEVEIEFAAYKSKDEVVKFIMDGDKMKVFFKRDSTYWYIEHLKKLPPTPHKEEHDNIGIDSKGYTTKSDVMKDIEEMVDKELLQYTQQQVDELCKKAFNAARLQRPIPFPHELYKDFQDYKQTLKQ